MSIAVIAPTDRLCVFMRGDENSALDSKGISITRTAKYDHQKKKGPYEGLMHTTMTCGYDVSKAGIGKDRNTPAMCFVRAAVSGSSAGDARLAFRSSEVVISAINNQVHRT